MIRSSIDIGTNSVLLLIADLRDNNLSVVHEEQRIPRLGKGVDRDGKLSDTAQLRVLSVLNEYRDLIRGKYTGLEKSTIVTATSAVRDASNRNRFIQRVEDETGWQVQLLTGKQEAKITFMGALSVLGKTEKEGNISVLDIGGGSTEIASGKNNKLGSFVSLNMGSVRFTERFLTSDPPTEEQVTSAVEEVEKMLIQWNKSPEKIERLVGVAGTVTSIAGIHQKLERFDAKKINGHRLPLSFVEQMIDEAGGMPSNQIERKYPVFLKGRGDVIAGGLIILSKFMKHCRCEEITVSTGGIRHGMLINIREK